MSSSKELSFAFSFRLGNGISSNEMTKVKENFKTLEREFQLIHKKKIKISLVMFQYMMLSDVDHIGNLGWFI